MSARRAALTWIALCGLLGSCSDECSSYSSFSCKQIEAADYNVIFFFPSGTDQNLGRVQGLSQRMASPLPRISHVTMTGAMFVA
jgi:hypothetical protein